MDYVGARALPCYDFLCNGYIWHFGDEASFWATVFKWFTEFHRGRCSLCNEKHMGRPSSAVIPENVSRVLDIRDDKRCTYQMLEATLDIGSVAIDKILQE